MLSMDELNLDQAPQDIDKEEFQLESVRLQAFVAATDPGSRKIASKMVQAPRMKTNFDQWAILGLTNENAA
ncbi:hypothetical protein TNCV_1240671 [Trichonephila clavipes]|uniref:Uncharacterized protein n=1 Tax=Trichonephila clavipes TaxID=2585209 RepID=A0A8X6WFG4_TRICX|nr:hypothetical protein TNCV_1240671 [Trichonephila clavipes]